MRSIRLAPHLLIAAALVVAPGACAPAAESSEPAYLLVPVELLERVTEVMKEQNREIERLKTELKRRQVCL